MAVEQKNAEEMSSAMCMSTEVVQHPLSNSRAHAWRIVNRTHPSWWNGDQVLEPCMYCKPLQWCPRFLVSIRPPNPEEKDLSLAVPGRFWKLYSNMLECDELQLKGPNEAIIKVKVKKTYHEEEQKLKVRLESNWKAFLLANNFQVGDILEFFLVASSCFIVYRTQKYQLARAIYVGC